MLLWLLVFAFMDKLFVYLTDLSGGVTYFIIFGILVACGLGFPLPEDIPLIATGYLIWDETLKWVPAIGITMVGVLIGDSILFFIGRKLGVRFLEQGKVQLMKPERVRRAQAYFRKYGEKIVFFARFVAGFRAAAFFLAGAMKMPYTRFIWLDGLAAALSVPIWIVLGYGIGHYFGDDIHEILLKVKHLKNGFTILVFTALLIFAGRSYLKYKKAQKLKLAKSPARASEASSLDASRR